VQRRRLVRLPKGDRVCDLHTRERLVEHDVATDEILAVLLKPAGAHAHSIFAALEASATGATAL
jgi:hypothetical protein